MSHRAVQIVCYTVSAGAIIGAGAYLMLGTNKGLGIFLLIAAIILSRVLVLNIAMQRP